MTRLSMIDGLNTDLSYLTRVGRLSYTITWTAVEPITLDEDTRTVLEELAEDIHHWTGCESQPMTATTRGGRTMYGLLVLGAGRVAALVSFPVDNAPMDLMVRVFTGGSALAGWDLIWDTAVSDSDPYTKAGQVLSTLALR